MARIHVLATAAGVALAVVVTGAVLSGTSVDVVPRDDLTDTVTEASNDPLLGPGKLRVPIEIRPVVQAECGAASLRSWTGDQCFVAGPPGVVVRELEDLRRFGGTTTAGLTMRLAEQDAAVMRQFSGEHFGERLGVVMNDLVLVAPTVTTDFGGSIEVPGNSPEDIERLLTELRG